MTLTRAKKDDIPDDVYVQFVKSLFASAHILLVGGASYFFAAVIVYHQTSQIAFLAMAPVLLLANVWRYLGIKAFHKEGGQPSLEDAKRWENDYILRGIGQGLAVSSFGFLSIYVYPSPLAEAASVAMAVASLITVATRNYGSKRMVRILSLSFVGPAAVAFLLRGDIGYALLGVFILPMLFVTISTASSVRRVLFDAIIGEKRADLIAERFDRALNTMPQGLLMFDKSWKVIVANAEAAQLIGLRSPDVVSGRSLSALMLRIAAAGLLDRTRCLEAAQRLIDGLHEKFDSKLLLSLSDGRYFEFSTREGDNDLGVVMFEDVTSREQASQRISTMARFDSLTDLPNRAHFHELMAARLASGDPRRRCALAIFDLDDFKGINDTLGHPAGDQLIRTIGKRLLPMLSDGIVVGRMGGDEFVVYLDNVEDQEKLGRFVESLRARCAEEVEIFGNLLRVQVSCGAVLAKAADADADAMAVHADLALQDAKTRGKNGWSLFQGAMEQSFRLRQMLKVDLRAAIRAKDLRVVYQPIVALNSHKIDSCEALCRWDHPELGGISPAIFIPLAEETGLISEITAFVLQRACLDCAQWPDQIGVSVNLSAKDFVGSIVENVTKALDAAGLSPARLELEVTETSLLDDKSSARTYIEQLRKLGVRIALDDFGTGYSSLSYLHRLSLDKIKIDRSFLMDMLEDNRSLQLLKSVVQMSHRLGMSVTVEGVETFDQLGLLSTEVKPDLVQGFLFGAALTTSGIQTMSTTAWPFSEREKMASTKGTQKRRLAAGV